MKLDLKFVLDERPKYYLFDNNYVEMVINLDNCSKNVSLRKSKYKSNTKFIDDAVFRLFIFIKK